MPEHPPRYFDGFAMETSMHYPGGMAVRMRKVLASCVVYIFNLLPMKLSVTEGCKGGTLHKWSGPPWSIRGPKCCKGARTVVMGTDST